MQASAATERAAIDAEVSGKTLCDLLLRNAETYGDQPALSWNADGDGDGGWQHLTWRGYRDRVAEAAMGLAALGVGRGDFVAIMTRNRPEHLIADLAALHLGAVPVSFYNTLAPEQIAYIAAHCEAKVAVLDGRQFMERWEKVKDDLPNLTHAVLLEDAADFADYGWVRSWDVLLEGGRAALASADGRARFDAAWRQVTPDDLVTVMYTSGTTGPPKGVMTTHYNALWTAAAVERWTRESNRAAWEPGATYLSYLPLAHSLERLSGHYAAQWRATSVWFCPEVLRVVEYLPQVRPATFVAVPRLWEKAQAGITAALAAEPNPRRRRIAEQAIASGRQAVRLFQAGKPMPLGLRLRRALFERLVFSKIRHRMGLDRCLVAFSGAAPLAEDVLEFFLAIGIPLREGYGLTESTAPASLNLPERVKVGTVGPALPGVEMRVADDGELLIRGGNVAKGYYKDPEQTAATFGPDGWLHTGDVAEVDEDGFIRIVDRKKELLITAGGDNVSPSNLENLLKAHPLIAQACAVGDRKPYIAALVVLDGEVAPGWAGQHGIPFESLERFALDERIRAELQQAVDQVNQHVARIEQIKRFTVLPTEWTMDSEELTPTLKLKRRVIHQKYAAEIQALYQ